jgi:homoserine kinase
MADRLHQPYRSRLFPGGEAIMDRVRGIPGCLGVAISGSGPTVAALVRGRPSEAAETMCRTFSEHGVASQFFVLRGTASGARVVVPDPQKIKVMALKLLKRAAPATRIFVLSLVNGRID